MDGNDFYYEARTKVSFSTRTKANNIITPVLASLCS